MILFDTDHVSVLEWERGAEYERLRARVAREELAEVATTIVTYEEQTRGWLAYLAKARTVPQLVNAYQKLIRHVELYRQIEVVEFDERAAQEYERLLKSRVRVGTQDLKIAAISLANQALLLSRNLQHFRKVPGLKIEDWTK